MEFCELKAAYTEANRQGNKAECEKILDDMRVNLKNRNEGKDKVISRGKVLSISGATLQELYEIDGCLSLHASSIRLSEIGSKKRKEMGLE